MKMLTDKLMFMHILVVIYVLCAVISIVTAIEESNIGENRTYIIVVQPKVTKTIYKPVNNVEAVPPKPEVKSESIIPKVEPKPKEVVKSVPKIDDTTYLLAQIIHAEAKGEPYNGKIAVGNVVLNRVKHPEFPDTVKGVVFQKGQFHPVTNGTIYNTPNTDSLKAAKEAINGNQVVGGKALYFYNPRTSTSDWIFTRTTIMDICNHRFAY